MKSILGGLAGAAALNILHESIRRFDHFAPRVDLIGEEALTKLTKAAGATPLTGNARYGATLAGDLVSNALYFALIGIGLKKHLIARGAAYGLAAGVGALALTKPMGLSDAPVNRTARTQVMTVAYYAIGGLVAALAMRALKK
ncbi:hypothetical protein [Mucilaginibacter antarcticus]|uniref:Uncharacterized protein n=1 Tax=Mucilaginibacter antarcticus TaxID=1855725 RepID=A0ABW5XSJ5_9SPHI